MYNVSTCNYKQMRSLQTNLQCGPTCTKHQLYTYSNPYNYVKLLKQFQDTCSITFGFYASDNLVVNRMSGTS